MQLAITCAARIGDGVRGTAPTARRRPAQLDGHAATQRQVHRLEDGPHPPGADHGSGRGVEAVIETESGEQSEDQVAGDVQIYVPFKGLVDIEAEVQRLLKEIGKLDKDIEFLGKKLENPSFVERAPADVVAKEREKLTEFAAKKDVLEKSLEKIRSLR